MKGKKAPRKRRKVQKGKLIEAKGETISRKKTCPKCGAGVFMAEHKNRFACGKCGFTEWKAGEK